MSLSQDANTSNLSSSEANAISSTAPSQNQSLLLGNIHKVEGLILLTQCILHYLIFLNFGMSQIFIILLFYFITRRIEGISK